MIESPEKYSVVRRNTNEELFKLRGELDDKTAHLSLYEFLRHNLYIAAKMALNFDLAPYQEMILKGWFLRNFNLNVLCRGGSKSTLAAVFSALYAMLEPGAKIVIASSSFRSSRSIFNEMDKIIQQPKAVIARQAFGIQCSKRSDMYEWIIPFPNGTNSEIRALPLSGEKIRGFRANVLIVDEFLTMPKDTFETILTPFLSVPIDLKERLRVRQIEDSLIRAGSLKEEDRLTFENKTKVILLSSASYQFEYLYEKYCQFIEEIRSPKETGTSYFVCQMGYEALPKHMLNQELIEAAREGGTSFANFRREFCSIFEADSDSYYSAKKMKLVTIPDGEDPTLEVVGEKGAKYILAIDPSFSNSATSDFFAMAMMKLNEETETPTLVHNYAVAGGDLKDHIDYFFYLMTNFNVEMIIIDSAGFQFLDSATESEKFKKAGLEVCFFDFDSDLIGSDYENMLRKARQQFVKTKGAGRIAFKQYFTSQFIRNANVHLQTCIDHKKIWFASRINPNGAALGNATSSSFDEQLVKKSLKDLPDKTTARGAIIQELIDVQDALIDDVKKQCALIEVKSTPMGHQTFDLPVHLKKSTSPNRARKDNYTTLMLGCWATKCYFDLMRTPKNEAATFIPRWIG